MTTSIASACREKHHNVQNGRQSFADVLVVLIAILDQALTSKTKRIKALAQPSPLRLSRT